MPRTSRRTIASAVAALLVMTTLPLLAAPPSAAQEPTPVTRLIVLFKPGVSDAVQDEVTEAEGRIVQDLSSIRARVIEIPASIERLIRKRLARRGDVLAVEADLPVQAAVAPSEVAYANNPQAKTILESVAVPDAWDLTKGSTETVLAVLDTGVKPMSSDLATGRFVTGYNSLTGRTGSTATNDDQGHGTYVTSVAAAVGNNASGMAGVCWTCRIMPVKVLNSSGSGTTSQVAAGIDWAVSHGADLLSLSLSGGGTTTLKRAVDNAIANGVTVIAAAGNDGKYTAPASQPTSFPAGYPGVIAVGGVTSNAAVTTAKSNYGDWVSIAAPWTNLALNRSYQLAWFSGTSSATPVVSGIASLMLSVKSTLTPAEIRSILMRTATPHALDINNASGLVNARRALDDVLAGTPTSTSTSTSTTTSSTSSTSSSTSSTSTSTSTTSTSTSTTSTSTTTTSTTAPPPPSGTPKTVTGSGYGSTTHTLTVKPGRAVFSSCSTCKVGIYSSGQLVAPLTTGSITIASLPVGTYEFRATGAGSWTRVTYSITYQA
jgi:subtilisin family serine protease